MQSEGSVFYACGGRIPLSGTGADGPLAKLSREHVSSTRKITLMAKNDLDPFRIIAGVLANRGDSDLLVSVATAVGLTFNLGMSEQQAATHKTRIRALLPRIFAAYDALDDQARLTVAKNALANFGAAHWETRARAGEALLRAGWEFAVRISSWCRQTSERCSSQPVLPGMRTLL